MAQRGADVVRVVVSPYRICPLGAHIDHQVWSLILLSLNIFIHLNSVMYRLWCIPCLLYEKLRELFVCREEPFQLWQLIRAYFWGSFPPMIPRYFSKNASSAYQSNMPSYKSLSFSFYIKSFHLFFQMPFRLLYGLVSFQERLDSGQWYIAFIQYNLTHCLRSVWELIV